MGKNRRVDPDSGSDDDFVMLQGTLGKADKQGGASTSRRSGPQAKQSGGRRGNTSKRDDSEEEFEPGKAGASSDDEVSKDASDDEKPSPKIGDIKRVREASVSGPGPKKSKANPVPQATGSTVNAKDTEAAAKAAEDKKAAAKKKREDAKKAKEAAQTKAEEEKSRAAIRARSDYDWNDLMSFLVGNPKNNVPVEHQDLLTELNALSNGRNDALVRMSTESRENARWLLELKKMKDSETSPAMIEFLEDSIKSAMETTDRFRDHAFRPTLTIQSEINRAALDFKGEPQN